MKRLIDILARDLQVWPEAFEVMHGYMWHSFSMAFYKNPDWINEKVTRAEWQAAVDALNAPKVVEWDGESLPPVGLECEFHTTDAGDFWCRATVKFVGTHFIIVGYKHPNFGISEAGINHALIDFNFSELLRPIRTAEQVAAEEREKAINEMVFGVCGCEPDGGNTTAFMICGFIYDAGYRKEPKLCGS